MESQTALAEDTYGKSSLVELLDRVLNKGVVVAGDLTICVADIELIYLRLQLVLTSVETAREAGWVLGVAPSPGGNQ